MIDNEAHIDILERFSQTQASPVVWDVFIKVDMGTKRAGISLSSPRLEALIHRAEKSSAVSIHGFYCHAGHSYASKTPEAAAAVLEDEVSAALTAASYLADSEAPVTISVGATPTAHVVKLLQKKLPPHVELELHAGTSPLPPVTANPPQPPISSESRKTKMYRKLPRKRSPASRHRQRHRSRPSSAHHSPSQQRLPRAQRSNHQRRRHCLSTRTRAVSGLRSRRGCAGVECRTPVAGARHFGF